MPAKLCAEEELCLPLLSVSPLGKEDVDNSRSTEEAETFDSRAHVRHLEQTFAYYSQKVRQWALCSIGDNCSVNKRVIRLLRMCLEVKHMIPLDAILGAMVDSIHTTMSN